MSTIAEIESAIERLPSPEVARLAAWLEEFRHRRTETADGGHHDLDEFIGTWREDADFDAAQRAFAQVDEAMWKGTSPSTRMPTAISSGASHRGLRCSDLQRASIFR